MVSKAETLQPKSLERSPAVGDFYGTGIEIWAGFGPIGSTEKKGLGLLVSCRKYDRCRDIYLCSAKLNICE